MQPAPAQITLAGQVYNVRRTPDGKHFIGDEDASAFIERMSLLGRSDVLADLSEIGRAKLRGKLVGGSAQQTDFALHQARTRAN